MTSVEEAVSLKTLKRQRAVIKGQVTRLLSSLQNTTDLTVDCLGTRGVKLEELYKSYSDVQLSIEEEDTQSDHDAERANFEQLYFQVSDFITMRKCALQGSNRSILTNRNLESPNTVMIKEANALLPKIEIKPFDGSPIQWHFFRDTFKSLVHDNDDLPAVHKFHLLKNALRGEIAAIITSLDASEQNYQVAWDLLQKRCNKPRQIVYAHLNLILDLPEVTRDSPTNLRSLAEQAQARVNALKALEQPTEHWGTILVYILIKKLDKNTRRAWERTLEDDEFPDFERLIAFINKQARGDDLEIEQINTQNRPATRFRNKIANQVYLATNSNSSNCNICEGNHPIFACSNFLKLSVKERIDAVKGNKLCLNCLRANHMINGCNSSSNCRKCNKRHHTLLHLTFNQRTNETNIETRPEASTSVVKNALTITCNSEVLLGTALVKILDRNNKEHFCRILLDSGSQAHLMTEAFANKLGLRKHEIDLAFHGLANFETRTKYFINATLKSRDDKFSSRVTFITIPSITGLLPSRQIERSGFTIPDRIKLADPEFHKSRTIDALLGSALFYQLLGTGQIKLCDDKILLQKTDLGWIVTGSINWQKHSPVMKPLKVHHVRLGTPLDSALNKFWEIEEIPEKPLFSDEELQCERHFSINTRRDATGRYEVRLPFNQLRENIGDSRSFALKRLYSLERKFQYNTALFEKYKEFLDEYLALGHMAAVSPLSEQDGKGYYLPHHPVIKESSTTTKVRVVFDASAKSSTGVSLNDSLYTGPTIQDTLWSILLRFRFHFFVLTADIEKMFRQIKVHPDDAIYQKILWRDSSYSEVKTFILNTVTYGTAPAPFLAVRCLQRLAEDEHDKFPIAARIFKRDFYVDDVLTGAATFEEAIKLRDELIALGRLGGFHLRQWASNEVDLVKDLRDRSNQITLCLDHTETKKTLGIFWNPSTDNISYSVRLNSGSRRITKRLILSEISQLFDPLGLLGPVIIRAKILMQNIWKANVGWDESVPQHIYHTWKELKGELHLLNEFSIPRRIVLKHNSSTQLHGFCDASEGAYGACIFIRNSNTLGEHRVSLLCAKSRVAPIKTVSMPRLELCAARLLTRLYKEVTRALVDVKFDLVRFWSDSTITLQWIRTQPHTLKTFVANRVSEIRADTDSNSWQHVPTQDNPADYISRGQSPAQLINNSSWLRGPSWLARDDHFWPKREIPISDVPEKRNLVSLIIQLEGFAVEIHQLNQGKPLPKGSKILTLNPFLDDNKLLRVGGRLKHAPLNYEQKHPLLLPRNHHVTCLIIQDAHVRQWHAGIQATLNAVRQAYWPIDGKNNAKRIIHKCMHCYKQNPRIPNYIMGNLPRDRMTQARPFQNAGIDYCGPFHIKERKFRNRSTVKVWIAAFVCFATRAVHLELITDLTTEACLGALKRFFARRGKSINLYSDNGTNFVGAKNEIIKLQALLLSQGHNAKMKHSLADNGINWYFSPPRSPHFGGLWEAAVRSFKKHLFRTIGNNLFTYEQFNTIIIEIEAVLNSRPLIPLSSDPNDLTALCPSHFLIGQSLAQLPEHDLQEVPNNRLSLWQHIQKIKQQFWNRWHKEYLQILHTRSKWHLGDNAQIKEGTLVIVREDNTPPLTWKLGRIVEIHRGADHVTRVVTVRTADGTYKRSVKKLSPLPIETPD